jgi:hypothetical protein
VLRTADGTDFKSINDWTVEQLFDAIRQGANRPTTTEIHQQLNAAINYSFNFQQKIQVNYDALLAKTGTLKAVGIIIPASVRGHLSCINWSKPNAKIRGVTFNLACKIYAKPLPTPTCTTTPA